MLIFTLVGNHAGNVAPLCTKDVGFMLQAPSRLSGETISSVSKPLNLIKPGRGHSPGQGRMKQIWVATPKQETISLSFFFLSLNFSLPLPQLK